MSKMSGSIKYGEEFENMILSKAIELEEKGLSEGPLHDGKFKDITVYINKVPAFCLYKCTMAYDAPFLASKTISAGTE